MASDPSPDEGSMILATPRRTSRRRLLAGALGLAAIGLLSACGGSATVTATTSSAAPVASSATSSVAASTLSAVVTSSTAATATSTTATAITTAATATTTAIAAATTPPRPGTTLLLFWANGAKGDPSFDAWVKRISDFNQANPTFTAEMDAPANLNNKLAAAVAGGDPPSVAVQDRYTVAAGSAAGLMMDIAAFANQAGIKGSDEQPWCWQEVFIKGKLYGLPYSTDSRRIYVNVSQLQQAGLPATVPKSLDDFTQIGQQLSVKNGTGYERIGFIPWGNNWEPYGWGWLFGGNFYDSANNVATLTDPKIVAAYEWAGTVARQLGYQAVQTFRTANKSVSNLFVGQLQSTLINSTSFLITVNNAGSSLNWNSWAPPPPSGVSQTSTWSGGFCDVLPSGVKNPDQSFSLANYLTDATMQRLQMTTGRLPTIKAVAADPYWNTVDPRTKAFIDMLPYSHSRPVTPQVNIMTTDLNNAHTAVISGKQTASAALQQANQIVNDAIKNNRV